MAHILKKQASASVTTPQVGEMSLFVDSADNKFKRKDDTGAVTNVEDVAAGVTSFEGRGGVVVSAAGDYTASEITNIPSGDIVATNLQAAINELDTEKAPAAHVGSTGVSEHGVASSVVAGFMSPADKIKLDSITLADIQGSLNFKGLWNASINSPALVSSVGTKGHYYVVSVAGSTNLDGITDWKVNDWAIFNGATWQKLDDSETVVSVNGYTGAVVLAKADVGLGNVDNTSDLNKPISTATQTALDLKADLTNAINQLTGEATAGPGGGSQAVTLSNSAVIGKVLTGLTEQYGLVQATDSILNAIAKLTYTQHFHSKDINANVIIPDNYVLIRGETRVTGTFEVKVGNGSILKII